jgi:hypothetical protein
MALRTAISNFALLALLLPLSLPLPLAIAQVQNHGACREADLARMCQTSLPEGFTFLKRFLANGQPTAQEFSYVFSKDTEYAISFCTAEGKPAAIKLTLYDAYHNPIFTNYDKKTKSYHQAVGYVSQSTGVVHLKLEPEQGVQPCLLVNIGFKTGVD